jgi:hypothetical protein
MLPGKISAAVFLKPDQDTPDEVLDLQVNGLLAGISLATDNRPA